MEKFDVVLDFGSKYISAGLATDGFFVKIPAVVAVDTENPRRVLGVGIDALNVSRSSAIGVSLVHPISEGSVVDADGAKLLVEKLLERILPKRFGIENVRFTCVVSCGMISSDKATVENVLLSMGAKGVEFLETPRAAAFALFDEFHTTRGVVVDVGAECTDLAVVHGDNIVAGCTLYQSGKALTAAISDRLLKKYLIKLSDETAEELKLNLATLYSNDVSTYSVRGKNVQSDSVESVSISAKELYDTVVGFFGGYVKIVESLLNSVPEQISSTVRKEGVFLCGGGAKIEGLDAYLHGALNMPVRVSSCPEDASMQGALGLLKK